MIMGRLLITLTSSAAAVMLFGCTTNNNTYNNTRISKRNTTIVKNNGGSAAAKTYNGQKFDIDAIVSKMDAVDFECGEASDVGIWVVTKIEIPADDKVPANELLLRAALLAKQNIAEWISTEASATTSVNAEKNDNNGQVDVQQNIKVEVKSKSKAFMRGITYYRHSHKDGNFVAWYYATGKNADRSAELEAQLRATPPGVVRAIGVGSIVDGKISPAKRQARQSALQSAVEQVMGTTVIGQSQLMDNDKAKSKVIAQTVGSIKEYRIVKEEANGNNYLIILNAKVDEKKLLDNYSAMVCSMGNPGWAIKSQDPDLKLALGDFFNTLGFKVTTNPAETQFIVDADCQYLTVVDDHYGEGIQISVMLKIFDVKTKQQMLFTRNNPVLSTVYSGLPEQNRQLAAKRAFKSMKKELHEKLNKMVMDWVLNGREIKVVFKNLPAGELDEKFAAMINDVPCAKFLARERKGNTLTLNCSYVGPSADFEEFLRVRFGKDLPKGSAIPKTEVIELNKVEFTF